MPVLKSSASDFTAFTKANAMLPTLGKVVNSTNTASLIPSNVSKINSVVKASAVSAKASPTTTVVAQASAKSNGNKKGD